MVINAETDSHFNTNQNRSVLRLRDSSNLRDIINGMNEIIYRSSALLTPRVKIIQTLYIQRSMLIKSLLAQAVTESEWILKYLP